LDTESLTIRLPPYFVEHIQEILDKIPPTQRRSSIKNGTGSLGNSIQCHLHFQARTTSSAPCRMRLPQKQVAAWHLTRVFTLPLRTSGGCRRISAPNPLGLRRLCPSRQLPKGIMMPPDWALATFGFPVLTLPPAWVSRLHNLLYGGTIGQILSPLG
jgi:hypothetical protein